MGEAGDDYSDLLHHAMSWRALRRLMDDAAVRIEQPRTDRVLSCYEAFEGVRQLIEADTQRNLDRMSANHPASSDRLSQACCEHRARDALKIANDSTKVLNLVMTMLALGGADRWSSLFPQERGYLAAVLEWARQLGVFGVLTAPAKVMADELNRLGGVGGKRLKDGHEIVEWRKQVRSGPEDDIAKTTYCRVLDDLLKQECQPRTRADAIDFLKNLVRVCPSIDPRRLTDL